MTQTTERLDGHFLALARIRQRETANAGRAASGDDVAFRPSGRIRRAAGRRCWKLVGRKTAFIGLRDAIGTTPGCRSTPRRAPSPRAPRCGMPSLSASQRALAHAVTETDRIAVSQHCRGQRIDWASGESRSQWRMNRNQSVAWSCFSSRPDPRSCRNAGRTRFAKSVRIETASARKKPSRTRFLHTKGIARSAQAHGDVAAAFANCRNLSTWAHQCAHCSFRPRVNRLQRHDYPALWSAIAAPSPCSVFSGSNSNGGDA